MPSLPRLMAELPAFHVAALRPDYFPDLLLQDGRVFRETPTGLQQLENAKSTSSNRSTESHHYKLHD